MSESERLEDRELMVQARAGDRSAFAALVSRNQRPLVNFFRRCGVHTDAEDLAQETFVRVYRYRERYVPSAKFTTFLYMIARQVRVDWLRKKERRWKLIEKVRDDPAIAVDASVTHKRGARLDVPGLLEALPDGMREVVVLGIYRELPYAEISEILGIPEGTVKSRMYHALRRMRQMLEQDDEDK